MFQEDDYDELDWAKFPFSTTTTTTLAPPPLPLDTVMESLMKDVDTEELMIRFGHLDQGLSVRGGFGEPSQTEPESFRYLKNILLL